MKYIPKNQHSKRKLVQSILGIDNPTYHDLEKLKELMLHELHVLNLTPPQIKEKYNQPHENFSVCLSIVLGVKLKSVKDASNLNSVKLGRQLTDPRKLYYKECAFNFDYYDMPQIPGYELLVKYGVFHPVKNPRGAVRDHIVSKVFGWENNVDPALISHPCNCQWMVANINNSKGKKSWLTLEELKTRIENNDFSPIPISETYTTAPNPPPRCKGGFGRIVTEETRAKQRAAMLKYMNVTNGVDNLRILKTDPIPEGFRRGITTKPPNK